MKHLGPIKLFKVRFFQGTPCGLLDRFLRCEEGLELG